ncbi:MAG TPA: hypothetical protein EYP85_05450 [Armatimonadetes bacterium]|nr:hypothetical protein [Armatimonadota bacterium]
MAVGNKGQRLPSETRWFTDERTGAIVREATNFPAVHHHPYFTNCAWTPTGRHLIFISYRFGAPNLFAVEVESGEIVQLTDRPDLNPFSAVPLADGMRVAFTAGESVWAVPLDGGEEEVLAHFPGSRVGNLHLSSDGAWVVTNVRREGGNALTAVLTDGGGTHTILQTEREVGHVQFAPNPEHEVLYSSEVHQRIWLVAFDGTGNRWLYKQREGEWITHESWLNAEEVMFVHWPKALRAIHRDGTGLRTIGEFSCWHPSARRDGSLIVCDTHRPDCGLQLVDPDTGERQTLCYPQSSNLGSQWAFTRPAEGPDRPFTQPSTAAEARRETIYGPQWTHPHPSFSPDGQRVVFTSDRTGWSQVYVVELP